jgi:hypothetical protein
MFVRYVRKFGLPDELRRLSSNPADRAPFARGYNSLAYGENSYDVKLARALR